MSTQNNSLIVNTITKRMNAIEKYLKAEKVEIPVQGTLHKPAALKKLYQRSLDTRAAVTAGKAAYKGALTERTDAETDRVAADESLKAWVLARFGAGSTEAEEFEFAPRKVATVSAKTRALAVEKNLATREARGTKGKKQKQDIKGVIPAPTEPAAPANTTPSAPAPTLVAVPALLTPATAVPPSATTTVAAPPVATPSPSPAPVPTVTPSTTQVASH